MEAEPQPLPQKARVEEKRISPVVTTTTEYKKGDSTAELLGLLSYEEHMESKIKDSPDEGGVPIFVMLPLNTVSSEGVLNNPGHLEQAFVKLKEIGVVGVMVDVWWGVVEREPQQYDWAAYKELVAMVKAHGLQMQAVMSFHACGPNVGDMVSIPLPKFVQEAALEDPDIMYADQHGYHNPECLSLWADNVVLKGGRTPLECYTDFMRSFRNALITDIGEGRTIRDICVGCGPCGELRYPSYPENRQGEPSASQWRFPGVGEFLCYDRYSLADLKRTTEEGGNPLWGLSGPHDAGGYNDFPESTGFFRSEGGSWDSEYGHFFLDWYAQNLCDHGDRMLAAASRVFAADKVQLSVKLAGVHWWYKTRSHAAELTAGYYNTFGGRWSSVCHGYERLCELCAKYNARMNFTCVEMRDSDLPQMALCSPEGLLMQVRHTAAKHRVHLSGENALCRFDRDVYDRILECVVGTQHEDGTVIPPIFEFTFLRMFPEFFEHENLKYFQQFARKMREVTLPWQFAGPEVAPQPPPEEGPPGKGPSKFAEFLEFDGDKDAKREGAEAEGDKDKEKGYMLFRF